MRNGLSGIDKVKAIETQQRNRELNRYVRQVKVKARPQRYILICKVNNTRQRLPKTISIYEYMSQLIIKGNDRAKTIAYYPKKNFKLIDTGKDTKC